jgi:hypothetical protein
MPGRFPFYSASPWMQHLKEKNRHQRSGAKYTCCHKISHRFRNDPPFKVTAKPSFGVRRRFFGSLIAKDPSRNRVTIVQRMAVLMGKNGPCQGTIPITKGLTEYAAALSQRPPLVLMNVDFENVFEPILVGAQGVSQDDGNLQIGPSETVLQEKGGLRPCALPWKKHERLVDLPDAFYQYRESRSDAFKLRLVQWGSAESHREQIGVCQKCLGVLLQPVSEFLESVSRFTSHSLTSNENLLASENLLQAREPFKSLAQHVGQLPALQHRITRPGFRRA